MQLLPHPRAQPAAQAVGAVEIDLRAGAAGVDIAMSSRNKQDVHIGGVTELLHDYPSVHLIDNPAPDPSLVHRRLSRMFSGRRFC